MSEVMMQTRILRGEGIEGSLVILDAFVQKLQRCERTSQLLRLSLNSIREGIGADVVAYTPGRSGDLPEVDPALPVTSEQCDQLAWELHQRSSGSDRCFLFRGPAPVIVEGFPTIYSAALVQISASKNLWLAAMNCRPNRLMGSAELRLVKLAVSMMMNQRRQLQTQESFRDTLLDVVRGFSATIDAKDPYTRGHSERVAKVAAMLGRQMNLASREVSDLYLAGLLHDIGKIGISDHVLQKPTRLTPEEFAHIQEHPVIGDRIVAGMKQFAHLRPGVRNHHERFDGRGYPDNLAGEEIPFSARVLAVADAFDAMASCRPYRPGMPVEKVEAIIRDGAGTQWDPAVVEHFLDCREAVYEMSYAQTGASIQNAIDHLAGKDEHQSSVAVKSQA